MPIQYDMPLFRPPSEGNSLILQATIGCSHNACSFCEMYTSKKFRPRPTADVLAEIETVADQYGDNSQIQKVFLADGNALVLSNKRLMPILEKLQASQSNIRQTSCYALPADILRKSDAELATLHAHGLNMLYVGVESGDDEILRRINKGESTATTIEGIQKARNAGIAVSAMILNGVGGQALSAQHAANTATVMNATQPEFMSTLVVSFPTGQERFKSYYGDAFTPLSQRQLFEEERALLAGCELESTIFRSNHASNYLVLKGVLNQDKQKLIAQIDQALAAPESAGLRPESARGL